MKINTTFILYEINHISLILNFSVLAYCHHAYYHIIIIIISTAFSSQLDSYLCKLILGFFQVFLQFVVLFTSVVFTLITNKFRIYCNENRHRQNACQVRTDNFSTNRPSKVIAKFSTVLLFLFYTYASTS